MLDAMHCGFCWEVREALQKNIGGQLTRLKLQGALPQLPNTLLLDGFPNLKVVAMPLTHYLPRSKATLLSVWLPASVEIIQILDWILTRYEDRLNEALVRDLQDAKNNLPGLRMIEMSGRSS